MVLTVWDWLGIIFSFILVFGSIWVFARQSASVDGFSVGGRAASSTMVAGTLVGTIVGGSATIGTTQSAATTGLAAGWFAFGSGLGLAALGLFYAGPLRRSGLKTIAEFMQVRYGPYASLATSIASVAGTFFSIIASGISGIHFIQVLFPVSPLWATAILLFTVIIYVLTGGIKGTAVSGMIKTVLLYISLFIAGLIAIPALTHMQTETGPLFAQEWIYPHGSSWKTFATNCLSVIIGVMVTQSYAQAVYSAADTKSAIRGCMIAAVCCVPIAFPLIAIGIFMRYTSPDIPAVAALPFFMQMYLPPVIGGIAIGVILLSIIGSIAGLSLGAATSISVDIFDHGLGIQQPRQVFFILQCSLVLISIAAFTLALRYYDSQILYWNFLSFSLRGAGIFFPLLLAIYYRHFSSDTCVTANILIATGIALLSVFTPLGDVSLNPLYVGITISALLLGIEYFWTIRHSSHK